jgi:hypothetical protein
MSESKPSDDASLFLKALPELGMTIGSRISRDDTCLRTRRQSVYRRHELNTGFGMERENLVLDGKGNDKWQTP